MFKAFDFILDGKFLSEYGLFIQTINSKTNHSLGGKVNIFQEQLYKVNKPLFQGASFNGQKSFDVRIGSKKPLSQEVVNDLCFWLEGYLEYRRIDFIQQDLSTVHFNVIIEKVDIGYIGNNPCYLTLSMICDSSYGYENKKQYKLNIGENKHMCTSAMSGYTSPILKFRAKTTTPVRIVNRNNNSENTELQEVIAQETIIIDNEHQVITSDQGRLLGKVFNYRWFNLVRGMNIITITGDIENITIEYENAKSLL